MVTDGTTADFSFNSLGLGSVLKLHRLSVPMYQREYSWKEGMVEQLFTDLSKAMTDQQSYFLGTVVTIPSHQDSDKLEVVDGQQRLTTTAILLAAIRDYLQNNDPDSIIIESINNEFLNVIDRRRADRVPRLELNVDDRAFFKRLLDGDNLSPQDTSRESHRRLLRAKAKADGFVRNILSPYDSNEHSSILVNWIEFLERRATVILLRAPDSAHAFRMFETLNDRGLRTSQADLVKNFLFGEAGDRVTEAQARWSGMLTVLEEVDDEDRSVNFLRHGLIATKAFTRTERVYATVQAQVRGETNAIQFLTDLERLSSVYVATFQPDSDYWSGYSESARRALKTLRLLDIKPFRPILLSLGERFDPTEGATAFRLLISIGVRSLVSGKIHAGQMDEVSSAAALKVYRREVTNTDQLREAMRPLLLSDDEFRDSFKKLSVSKHALGRYYLHALEMTGIDSEPEMLPNEDPQHITLEHILPKKPAPEEWSNFEEDQVRLYSRRLGNLCLLQRTPNSNARSDAFASKVGLYAASSFALTSSVAECDDWSPEEIVARQDSMADTAITTWSI